MFFNFASGESSGKSGLDFFPFWAHNYLLTIGAFRFSRSKSSQVYTMPRSNRAVDTLIPAKVRKRGSSPAASSSSSIVQHYRFKRAILIGKRGGSTTPMPTWRLMSSRSPSLAQRTMESPQFSPSRSGKGKLQEPVSARKLAATLWEMNEMPSPRVREGLEGRRLKKEGRGRERIASSVRSGSLPPHLSDPSHSPVSEVIRNSVWMPYLAKNEIKSEALFFIFVVVLLPGFPWMKSLLR